MKKQLKKKKLQAKRVVKPTPKRSPKKRKATSDGGLRRDIAKALAYKKRAMAAAPIKPKSNGDPRIPTSFKFSQADIQLLETLKDVWGTTSRAEVVRRAMQEAVDRSKDVERTPEEIDAQAIAAD